MSSCVGNVTADEITPERVSGVHHHEGARRRIDDEVTRNGDSTDQARDESDRLGVRIKLAGVDFEVIFSGQRFGMP